MIYRVILRVSYSDAFFDFDNAADACNFATVALEHSADSEDQKKKSKITLVIINPNKEEEED